MEFEIDFRIFCSLLGGGYVKLLAVIDATITGVVYRRVFLLIILQKVFAVLVGILWIFEARFCKLFLLLRGDEREARETNLVNVNKY